MVKLKVKSKDIKYAALLLPPSVKRRIKIKALEQGLTMIALLTKDYPSKEK